MKKLILVSVALLPLAAASCTTTERNAAVGAASGAVIGGAITNDVGGAAAGAVIGGAAGVLLSQADRPGYCVYRDRYGRHYEARCN